MTTIEALQKRILESPRRANDGPVRIHLGLTYAEWICLCSFLLIPAGTSPDTNNRLIAGRLYEEIYRQGDAEGLKDLMKSLGVDQNA